MASQVAAAAPPKAYKFARVTAYDGGIGAFATRDLKRGEVLLREAPIVQTTMERLEADVAALDDRRRKQLFSLCDWRATAAGAPKTALGVFQANGYPAPFAGGGDGAAVFLAFSRFNHGCAPNVHHAWDPARREKVVFAARDVPRGAELLTNYVDPCAARADRRAALEARFGFACACAVCGLADPAPSDARRTALADLDASIFAATRRGRYADALRDAESRVALLRDEGLDSPANLVRTCHDAYQAATHGGMPDAARAWLAKVVAHSRDCEPPESAELARLTARLAALSQ